MLHQLYLTGRRDVTHEGWMEPQLTGFNGDSQGSMEIPGAPDQSVRTADRFQMREERTVATE